MQEEFYRQAIDVQFSVLKGGHIAMKRDQTGNMYYIVPHNLLYFMFES